MIRLIYEKNCRRHITVSKDELCGPRITVTDVAAEKKCEAKKGSAGAEKSKRHLHTLLKKIQLKKRLSVIAFAVCVCVFGFFIADHKMFGGNTRNRLFSAVKGIVFSDSGHMSKEAAIPERTIYSLSFSESSDKPDLPHYESPAKTVTAPQTDASSAVSASVSETFVDGTKLYPISKKDLSGDDIYALSNETNFKVDIGPLLENTPKSLENIPATSEPLVLILHTHGCESYSQYETAYPEGVETRSEDTGKNVVQTGKVIAETLSDFGIPAVHCETLHDKESFINAYSESAKSVKEYLEQYPSIKFVLDVHRDAIVRDDGESISACTEIAGQDFAQIMFVVGSNEQGHNHPLWKDNLSLALHLQQSISETYPSLCRSINLRSVPFNQQLSDGYLLVEIGTSANTLDEALRSARAFGQEFARMITSNRTQA